MPDPIDLNNPPATPPTLPDPQDVVDAALATEPTVTTPSPVPELATVPETATVSEVPESVAPTPPPTPTAIPEPENISVPVGDEVPLAFVTPPPTTTTTTKPVDDAAPLPPVPPVVPMAAEQPKKKKSVLKIVGLVIGLFVGLGIVGSVAYQTLTGESLIAILQPKGRVREIDNPGDCDGESNGGWLVWRNGECKVTGISGSEDKNNDGVGDKDTVNPVIIKAEESTNSNACSTNGGTWCQYGNGFCISNSSTKGCMQVAIDKGIKVTTGANFALAVNGSCPAGYQAQDCKCGSSGTKYCFDTTGVCGGSDDTPKSTGYTQDTLDHGLCAITPAAPTNDDIADRLIGGSPTDYFCPDEVENMSAGCQLNVGKKPANMNCFCGTYQFDSGTGFKTTTMKCGCDKKSDETTVATDTTTTTPTMACTGLTRVPTTTPTVGQAMTFSCAGSVTPSSAGTLSYKYRYSLNSGSYLPMTSNVLTIAACGSYSVQCQACTTLNGVLTCDPVWTGATP